MKNNSIVIPVISLLSHGGTRILVELANFLSNAGFEVTILVPKGKVNSPYQLADGVNLRQINIPSIHKYLDYFLFLVFLPFYLRNKGVVIANFFVTMYPIWFASIMFKTKYIYFVQGIESEYRGISGKILNYFCDFTYKSKNIIAANEYLAKKLEAMGVKIKISINIGPASIFYNMSIPEIKEKEFHIVYFLRHESWKRRDRFDKIVNILRVKFKKEFKLLCISQDVELLNKYKKICHCVKPKNDKELIELLDSSKVLLLTSDYEGFSLPPLEAMARGIPVVLYECGGPSLYIEHTKNSFLVDEDDEELACKYLIDILENDVLYEKLSMNAIKTAQLYQANKGFQAIVDVIKDMCD